MSENFINAIQTQTNFSSTQNGAISLKSTKSSLLDLFSVIGSLRNKNENEIENLFIKAFYEDKLLATKMLFYCRDIRNGGLGERNTFRVILKYLANNYPSIVKSNLNNNICTINAKKKIKLKNLNNIYFS